MRIEAVDHVVFTVADPERSVRWWADVFGAGAERLEEWRRGEVPFVSVRLTPDTLVDLVAGERTGQNVDHMAVTVSGVDLEDVARSGRVEVESGPYDLFGARGTGRGLYVLDPDGNRVELRTY